MVKLVEKKILPYSGKVYDLFVENSHTYNVEKISVHNSSGGSLVNYLCNITMLDPIKHSLLFERFLSVSRKDAADIDSDVELKDQVLDILKDYFGEDDVLAISNYNRLQLKSLVKDIARLYGVEFGEVNNVTKVMEGEAKDKIMNEIGHDQKLYEFTFEKAKQYSPTFQSFLQKYPNVGLHITNLFKEIKSIGRHAGGVLVVPDAECQLPIIKSKGVDQSPITEGLTAHHLGEFGLIKFDVLGLATLRIIRRCIEEILKEAGNKNPTIDDVWEWYNNNLHPDIINTVDKKVFENVYHQGQWPSIFQFAEGGIQSFCKKAKPVHVDDISAISALWRPGPLKGKANERYLASRPSDVAKEHPIIQEVLGDTRGILLYQEQFMLLANKLAGFTLEEANKLRKLLVRPETSLAEETKKERIEIGKKFINGCIEKGLSKVRATNLWEREILGFISYGFNKSHSQAYAFNSYHCAWLYTYYDKHWIKACLECDPDLEKTINVVRSLGVIVEKCDVNLSEAQEWSVLTDGKSVVPALTSLKGIGIIAADELVRIRPDKGFKDIHEFFFDENGKWKWSKLNKKVLQVLIKVEAFDSFKCVGEEKIFKNYKHMENVFFGEDNFNKIKKGKLSLVDAAIIADKDDWTVAEKIVIQKEIMGFYNKNLIVGEFLDAFKHFNIKAIDESSDKASKIHVWGIIEEVSQKTTRTKKPFLVVRASGMSEKQYLFRVWNESLNESTVWESGNIVLFSLDYDKKWGFSLSRNEEPLRITK